jgi:Putative zinc-finger
MTHPSDETLNDYIERELSPADHVRVAAHLETCANCALVVEEIHHVLREAASLGPIAPPPHVWTRLQAEIDSRDSADSRDSSLSSDSFRRLPSHRIAWALATAALVVMAFLAGRLINLREQQPGAVPQAAVAGSTAAVRDEAVVRERVLLIAVGDHLERSQMVLVELAHAETRGSLDISAERQLADDLVASNRLYRQTAVQMGQANVAGLLDELERVLLEVARGPSTVNMRQLAIIQQQIEAQGILFKMKVVGSDIRQPPGL